MLKVPWKKLTSKGPLLTKKVMGGPFNNELKSSISLSVNFYTGWSLVKGNKVTGNR